MADVNHQNEQGCSSLHLAVRRRDLKFVKQLLDSGADITLVRLDTRLRVMLQCQQGRSY